MLLCWCVLLFNDPVYMISWRKLSIEKTAPEEPSNQPRSNCCCVLVQPNDRGGAELTKIKKSRCFVVSSIVFEQNITLSIVVVYLAPRGGAS